MLKQCARCHMFTRKGQGHRDDAACVAALVRDLERVRAELVHVTLDCEDGLSLSWIRRRAQRALQPEAEIARLPPRSPADRVDA